MKLRTKAALRPIMFTSIVLLLLTFFSSALAGNKEAVDIADASDQETAVAVKLPTGAETFKIEINEDGLYAVTGADLAAAGMNLAAVDPDQIQMMHRGSAVAYQFVNLDGSPGFGSNDEVRFYGWAFDGSRYEDMYVNNNVFWLWAGGPAIRVQTADNEAGIGYAAVTEFQESITKWPHENFFSGLQVDWDESPNDATAWHWERVRQFPGSTEQTDLRIDLPNPASGAGKKGTVLVEVTSRFNNLNVSPTTFMAEVSMNESGNSTPATWNNGVNFNILHDEPIASFLSPGETGYPTNRVNFELVTDSSDTSSRSVVYLTRVTVDYPRELVAVDDQLIFGKETAGNSEFQVQGFSDGASGKIIAWDISNRYRPVNIDMAANQQAAAEATTAVIGRSHDANARFIATTSDNLRTPLSISQYVPADLTPPGKAGTWVAVTHASLRSAAEELAQYRAAESSISTWVVDVEDIANQIGYGFNTPQAIREYLEIGRSTWSEQPRYLTLFGDATMNPRGLDCRDGCGPDWDPAKPNLVPTDLLFIDRFNGLIPVDYSFGLIEGNDLRSEVAVGRVAAENLTEAQNVVQKVIAYEGSFDNIQSWHRQMVFVADNPDSGGAFCGESKHTAGYVPGSFVKTFLCLPEQEQGESDTDYGVRLQQATDDLRDDLFDEINNKGMAILNYRGHGGITVWASPNILTSADTSFWQNVGRPIILLSADCLDGNFASPSYDGLGETFHNLGSTRGTVAHWSSSGLGYAFEHSILHNAFYEGMFDLRLTAIGDLTNYAKTVYLEEGNDVSEAYAFTLLGDPAMTAYPVNESIHLPVVIRP